MRGASEPGRKPAARGRGHVVGWLLVAGLCVALLWAATGASAAALQTADNTTNETATKDTAAPSLVSASKTNATAINVTVADDSEIRTSAITNSTFSLSAGRVRNVSTQKYTGVEGTNGTYVTLVLPERLNTDNVTISVRGNISDEHGNSLTAGNVTVSGMDTSVPAYDAFTVEQLDQQTVEIRLVTNERLAGISVAVTGPSGATLARDDFAQSVGRRVVYTAEYTFTDEGSHSIVWERARDRYDNTRHLSQMRQFYYEDDAPDTVLSAPETAAVGESVTFDAGESTDKDGIDAYRWRIDGGTILTGSAIDIAFASAGTHDVVLEVTDTDGNTAVTTRQVQVITPEGVPSAVRVTQENATAATATVNGTGFLQQIRAERGVLVTGATASLERVTAVFPANRSVMLSFRSHDSVPPSYGGTGLARFDIEHASVPAENVTVRFAVNRSALSGADPSHVALYREDGAWTPLPTTVVSESDERLVFEATSPGLSRFVVAVTGEEPATTPQAATAEPGTPSVTESRAPEPTQTPADGVGTDTPTATPAPSQDEGGLLSFLPDSVTGLVPDLPTALPNPLALWPDGIVGTILAGVLGFVAVVYGILKALAIYLGY